MLSKIWAGLCPLSLLFAILNGRTAEVSSALLEEASSDFHLVLTLGEAICLWSGIIEVLARFGLLT